MKPKFRIIMTPMWPCCWKVVPAVGIDRDNSTHLYHRSTDEAEKYIERTGGELV